MGKMSKAFEKSYSKQKGAEPTDQESFLRRNREQDLSSKTLPAKFIGVKGFFENEKWDVRLKMSTDPHSPWFESFRRLRTPILYPTSGNKPKTILVTSVAPHEGKGFICANLGIAIAQDMEHHALMLDCDFRNPSLAQLFGVHGETGLVDHLKNNIDLSMLIRKTGQAKLSLLPCGKPPRNPSEILSSNRMKTLIKEVSERYEDRIILFDSPPNIVASETGILAKALDGVILVVRHGITKKELVKKFVDSIGPEKLLGLVYNGYPQNTFESFIDKKMGYGYDYSSYYK